MSGVSNYLNPCTDIVQEWENVIMEDVNCLPKVVANLIASYVSYRFNYEHLNGASAPEEVQQCLTLLFNRSMRVLPFHMDEGFTIKEIPSVTKNGYWFIVSSTVLPGTLDGTPKSGTNRIQHVNSWIERGIGGGILKLYPFQKPRAIEIARAIEVSRRARFLMYKDEATYCEGVDGRDQIIYQNSEGITIANLEDLYRTGMGAVIRFPPEPPQKPSARVEEL